MYFNRDVEKICKNLFSPEFWVDEVSTGVYKGTGEFHRQRRVLISFAVRRHHPADGTNGGHNTWGVLEKW